jgi:hypothetical protein
MKGVKRLEEKQSTKNMVAAFERWASIVEFMISNGV